MKEVSIIINGVRYDAVDDSHTFGSHNCDLYDKDNGCRPCVIGMNACERLTGVNGIFKKSTKSFEP